MLFLFIQTPLPPLCENKNLDNEEMSTDKQYSEPDNNNHNQTQHIL